MNVYRYAALNHVLQRSSLGGHRVISQNVLRPWDVHAWAHNMSQCICCFCCCKAKPIGL